MPEPIIVLRHLQKSFGSFTAVDRLSLQISPHEIFGFLGANGAGKTTTIQMLTGLSKPSAGSASIAGLDSWLHRSQIRSLFGYVPQKFSLYHDLTVLENLRFFASAYRVPPSQIPSRIQLLLETVDLASHRLSLAGSLSGGLKQLLAIAAALLHQPPILFLDEPTSGLDPVHRQQIWDLLYELAHNGTTIFVSTHYMDEAERCSSVGFLSHGQLLARASPRSLKASLSVPLLDLQVDPIMPALLALRSTPGVLGVSLRSGLARIYSPNPHQLAAQWQSAWPFPHLTYLGHSFSPPDMEDVFKAYSQNYHAILSPLPS